MAPRVDFVKEFNRRLGQYTGSRAMPTPDLAMQLDLSARLANLATAKNQQEFLDYQKKSKGSRQLPKATSPEVLGNLTQETLDLVTEAGGDKSFMGVDMPNIWEIPGPVGRALGPVDEALIGLNIQAPLKLAGTTLDLLSRPAYAEFSAMKNQAQAYNEGKSIQDQLTAAGEGLWTGLKGDTKTGFGDVVEEWTKAPDTGGPPKTGEEFAQKSVNAMLGGLPRLVTERWLKEGNKEGPVNTWAKRGLGVTGELALDPLNIVGGKVVGMLKGAGDEIAQYSEQTYRQLAKDAAREGIDQQGWTGRFGRRPQLRPRITDPVTGKVTLGPQQPVGFDYIDDMAEKAFDDTMFQTGGGATSGRLVGQNQAPFAVANNMGIAIRQHLTSDFDNLVKYFVDDITAGNMPTTAKINALRRNPHIADFLDELLALSKKSRPAQHYTDIERVLLDYARNPGPGLLDNVAEASARAKSKLDDGVLAIQDNIHNKLLGQSFNAPGVKIAGKTIPFKRVGAMYANRKLEKLGGGLLKDVKYGDTFVGRTPQVAQRVRSLGMARYEQFHRAVTNMVNGKTEVYDIATRKMKTIKTGEALTRAERKAIQHNILNEIVPNDPRLREAQEFVQDAYKKMFQEEVDAGLRSANEIQAPNYVYNYYKGSDIRNRIDEFRGSAKSYLKRTGKMNPNQAANAKAKGLRPEEDAFRALLHRQLKSNRQLTRTWFRKDLLENYGVMGNQLSPDLVEKMRLVEQFKRGGLPRDIEKKLGMLDEGDAWYLPKDIDNVYKAFTELSAGKPQQLQGLIRFFDNWTRYFKTAATIPWPGFHIRNSIGDIYMSWIDGVRSSDIAFLKKWQLRAARDPSASIDIAGRSFTFDEMRNIFRQNASSGGYQNVELIGGVGGGATDVARGLTRNPAGVGNLARKASGAREDLFRFNHFLHAMREELPKAMNTTGNSERALKRAIDASTYRVNKYLFDYGALTGIEQKYLKRAMPFYTYTRKVLPTLMESLFLHPSQFAKTNRLMLDDAGDTTYNDMLTPQYQREIGYARLSDEDDSSNPWILGGQFLPTDVLNRMSNISSVEGFMQTLTSQVNPYMKAPFELAGGKQYFNDQPIDTTGGYLTDAMVPPVRPLQDIPGVGEALSKLPVFGETSKEGWLERVLSGRMGLGLPFDKVNKGQQTAAAYGVKEEVEARLAEYDTELEKHGYKLYLSTKKSGSGPSFSIRRLSDDEVVYETTVADDAIAKAEAIINR